MGTEEKWNIKQEQPWDVGKVMYNISYEILRKANIYSTIYGFLSTYLLTWDFSD